MSKGVQPIANMEAEQSVLGAIMVRPEAMDELSDSLLPDDFYREAHGMIFGAMLYLYEKREPVDLVTVTSLLKERGQLDRVGGVVFLAGLTEQVGFATNAAHYAKIVKDKARLRNFHQLTSKLVGDCHGKMDSIETFLDHAEAQLIGVSEAREMHVKSMAELVPVASDRIEKRYENRGMLTGIPTGFTEIDQLTGGFQSSDLIIIAGRPSMGKTALALNIAENAALLFNAPALVFSMEMSDGQLTDRMIAGNARVDAKLLKSGLLTKDEWARVARAEQTLMDAPIYICDRAALTPTEIRAQARRAKKKYGIKLILVDYIQLAQDPRAGSREQEISSISRSLKALAKELNIPVVALSQLNREVEKRDNKRPKIADLRESGALEQDADLIFFIYRQDAYEEDTDKHNRQAEVRLAKHRNGPVGTATLSYFSKYVAFKNLNDKTMEGEV